MHIYIHSISTHDDDNNEFNDQTTEDTTIYYTAIHNVIFKHQNIGLLPHAVFSGFIDDIK